MDTLDQDVVNLAKAIRIKESGNRAVVPAEGSKLGGASRYQYTHDTWKATAGKYLGDQNAPLSLQNENKATYLKIKDWKDKGYNPAQIASMWNAGEGRPNAYKENWKGTNKYGVAYDTPKYVSGVYNEYQKIKGGSQRQPAQPVMPTVAEQRQELQAQGQPVARNPERVEPTLGGKIARDVLKTPARLLENIKAIPKLIQGQSYEDATSSESKYFGGTIQGVGTKGGRTNLKNFGSQLKDTSGAGLELASYLPIGGAVSGTANLLKQSVKLSAKQLATQTAKRLGLNAVEGAVGNTLFEGGKKLQEEPDRESLGKSALYGAGGGLAFGLGGRAISGVVRGARKTAVALGKGAIPEDLATEATGKLKGAWDEYINDFKDLTSFRDKYKQKTGAEISDILTREVITPEINGNKIDLTDSMAKNEAKISSSSENVKGLAKAFNDVPVRLSDLERSAIGVVNDTDSILSSGNIIKARKGVEDLFKGLREAYGENINPEIANDIRLAMNRQTKAFTGSVGEMFEQDIANAVGDAVRTKLDEVIQDDVFRRANAEVGELLNVRKFMNKVNGKNIGGGRFSQAFAGIVGSKILGGANKLPLGIGDIVGYVGGRQLQKQANQYAFGKAGPRTRAILRRMENKSAIGAEVAEKTNNRKQVLLPARTSPVNKAFGSGKTINLPPKAQSTIDAQEMANLSLQKIKKGDFIEVKGNEVEVTLKTDDGIVVKDGNGKREFIPLQDTRGLKRVNQEFNDAEGEVATEMMDLSKAGKRIMRQDGSFVAEPSTFPKWISEDLRSMSLFKSVMEKIKNNKPIRGSREQRLYNEIKEEVTNRTIKKSDELAKAGEISLTQKANEMSFEDFEKFYNKNKDSIKENIPNLKKFWSENNYGGEQAFGAVAGLEVDEDGNIKFNKDKALMGVAGMAVAKKAGLMKGAKEVGDNLIQEAKKYKSAEEFVNNYKNKPEIQAIVHQGEKPEVVNIKDLFLSEDAGTAKLGFGKGIEAKNLQAGRKVEPPVLVLGKNTVIDGHTRIQQAIANREKTIPIYRVKPASEVKSQLTDIWNKANTKPANLPKPYEGEKDLTTKILKDLEGKSTVSKQYILDATNRGELKQVERDITRQVLEDMTRGSDNPLVQEAKKYKSAEEFVKAQGKPVFHGSTVDNLTELKTSSNLGRSGENQISGIYLTPDYQIASYYGRKNGVQVFSPQEVYTKGKILKVNDFTELKTKLGLKDLSSESKTKIPNLLKEKGYDGVFLKQGGEANEMIITNPDVVKTKSQLTDIYNQAQKSDTINVKEFADKVKSELLPLKVKSSDVMKPNPKHPYPIYQEEGAYYPKYESIALPEDLRGPVKNYRENIYESPIETSAGKTHFDYTTKNYFGHTRIEDMADNQTRRVIEVQSDLYQKGNLERESRGFIPKNEIEKAQEYIRNNDRPEIYNNLPHVKQKLDEAKAIIAKEEKKLGSKYITDREKELSKLQQYNDPTAHFRMVREEIKKAAQDGKTKLQFPTGETAMKIEGLGETNRFQRLNEYGQDLRNDAELTTRNMSVGQQIIDSAEDKWIITDVLGDGKFKAVPKNDNVFTKKVAGTEELAPGIWGDSRNIEEFDISGKVDTNNPIYKFYEKEVQKYLSKFGGTKVVDDKGVSWIEVPVKKEWAKMPVEAFAFAPLAFLKKDKTEESKTKKSGLFSNKTTYIAPKENPLLKEKQPLTDEKLGKALMQLESSGGKNKKNADPGEMKWLVGLTQDAIDELKRLKRLPKNFNKNNKDQVVKAGIEYFKLMQERNPKMTPAEVYVDKYWTQWKTETERAKKMIEFQNLISVENS